MAVGTRSCAQHKDQGYGRSHWVEGSIFWAVELRDPLLQEEGQKSVLAQKAIAVSHGGKLVKDSCRITRQSYVPGATRATARAAEHIPTECCCILLLCSYARGLAGTSAGRGTHGPPLLMAPVCATGSGGATGPVWCRLSEDGGQEVQKELVPFPAPAHSVSQEAPDGFPGLRLCSHRKLDFQKRS